MIGWLVFYRFFLDWVNKHLYPISNYTNVIEKIQSEFPKTQLLVLNGDNLIKFVFRYYFNNNWFNISLVQKSIRGSFEAGKISQTPKIFYWRKFFISEETPWIYENVPLLQKCYIRVLHEKWQGKRTSENPGLYRDLLTKPFPTNGWKIVSNDWN